MDGYSHERSAIRIDYVTVLFAASQIEQCFSTATLPAFFFLPSIYGIVSPITLTLWPRIGSQKKGWAKLSAWWSASRLGAPSSIQAYTTYMCYNYVYSNMYTYIYVADIASNQAFVYMNTSWKPILISTNHFLSKLVVKLVSWKHDTN